MIKAATKTIMDLGSFEHGEGSVISASEMSITTDDAIHMTPGAKFAFPNGKFITVGTECTIKAFNFENDVFKITDMEGFVLFACCCLALESIYPDGERSDAVAAV